MNEEIETYFVRASGRRRSSGRESAFGGRVVRVVGGARPRTGAAAPMGTTRSS